MGHSKTSRARITRSKRATEALELRKAGLTFKAIGRKMRISEQQAHRLVTEELARLNARRAEAAAAVTRLELERLDFALSKLWPLNEKGNVPAVNGMLAIMARRAKLLGLDAPEKVEMENKTIHLNEGQRLLAIGNIIARMLARLPPEQRQQFLADVVGRSGVALPLEFLKPTPDRNGAPSEAQQPAGDDSRNRVESRPGGDDFPWSDDSIPPLQY